MKVMKVNVKVGDRVKKGVVVATADTADLKPDRIVLQEIKAALAEYLQLDDLLDAKVRRKIQSLSRRVPEGSDACNLIIAASADSPSVLKR